MFTVALQIGAKTLLDNMGVQHKDIELDLKDNGGEYQEALKDISGRSTVPQVFLDGLFIGGEDDLNEKKSSGELENLFHSADISTT